MSAAAPPADKMLRPREVAARLDCRLASVLAWIRSGELRGVDVSATRGKRSRWRIAPEDLERFLLSRQATPAVRPARRRRPANGILEFF